MAVVSPQHHHHYHQHHQPEAPAGMAASLLSSAPATPALSAASSPSPSPPPSLSLASASPPSRASPTVALTPTRSKEPTTPLLTAAIGFSVASLTALSDQVKAVMVSFEKKESEETWRQLDLSIAKLSAAVSSLTHAPVVSGAPVSGSATAISLIRKVKQPIIQSLLSERSRLSKTAMQLLEAMAAKFGPDFAPFAIELIPTFGKLWSRANKVFFLSATRTMISIIDHSELGASIPAFVDLFQGPSKTLRTSIVECVNRVLEKNATNPSRIQPEPLEALLSMSSKDAAAEVRGFARQCHDLYRNLFPERADNFSSGQDVTQQKRIGSMSSSVSSPSDSSPPKVRSSSDGLNVAIAAKAVKKVGELDKTRSRYRSWTEGLSSPETTGTKSTVRKLSADLNSLRPQKSPIQRLDSASAGLSKSLPTSPQSTPPAVGRITSLKVSRLDSSSSNESTRSIRLEPNTSRPKPAAVVSHRRTSTSGTVAARGSEPKSPSSQNPQRSVRRKSTETPPRATESTTKTTRKSSEEQKPATSGVGRRISRSQDSLSQSTVSSSATLADSPAAPHQIAEVAVLSKRVGQEVVRNHDTLRAAESLLSRIESSNFNQGSRRRSAPNLAMTPIAGDLIHSSLDYKSPPSSADESSPRRRSLPMALASVDSLVTSRIPVATLRSAAAPLFKDLKFHETSEPDDIIVAEPTLTEALPSEDRSISESAKSASAGVGPSMTNAAVQFISNGSSALSWARPSSPFRKKLVSTSPSVSPSQGRPALKSALAGADRQQSREGGIRKSVSWSIDLFSFSDDAEELDASSSFLRPMSPPPPDPEMLLKEALSNGIQGLWGFHSSNEFDLSVYDKDTAEIFTCVTSELEQCDTKPVPIRHGVALLKHLVETYTVECEAFLPAVIFSSLRVSFVCDRDELDDKLEIDYDVDSILETLEQRVAPAKVISAVMPLLSQADLPRRTCFELVARILDSSPLSTSLGVELGTHNGTSAEAYDWDVKKIDVDSLVDPVVEGLDNKHPLTRKAAFDCAVALCRRSGQSFVENFFVEVAKRCGPGRESMLRQMMDRRMNAF